MNSKVQSFLNLPTLAMTPPMGWCTWMGHYTNISESVIKEIADIIVANGLDAVGYKYIFIDEGWGYKLQNESDHFVQNPDGSWKRTSDDTIVRDANGVKLADATKFPNGIAAVADYVHSKGLKLGIYSSPGPLTCFNGMGSKGYEQIDANTWASWGIDGLKYDFCSYEGANIYEGWTLMSKCLLNTGRDFLYYMCVFNKNEVYKWGAKISHAWRIGGDDNEYFNTYPSGGWGANVMDSYERALSFAQYSMPNGWNDTEVFSMFSVHKTNTEKETNMAINCILNLPMMLGGPLTNVSQTVVAMLKNKWLLGIHNDATHFAIRVVQDTTDIVVKQLQSGVAVMFLNKSDDDNFVYSGDLMDILNDYNGNNYHIYDCMDNGNDLGAIGSSLNFTLLPHQSKVLKVM